MPDAIDLTRRRLLFSATSTMALTACGGGSGGSAMMQTPPLGAALSSTPLSQIDSGTIVPAASAWPVLPSLANTSPLAGEFTSVLTAAATTVNFVPGVATQILAYNGTTPGPVIDIFEGDRVAITFQNQLESDSTVHWHGLPIPASQDGNPMDPVVPGATRVYDFTLPLGSAGTYWYHPHPHQTTAEQVFKGLAGIFLVRSRVDPLAALPERTVFITDLKLDANGQIPPNTATDLRNGREGNQLLVNGARVPVDSVDPGRTERWRVFNATNARYLRLVLDNATMQVAAHDGCTMTAPVSVSELLLAPAQRAEIIVRSTVLAHQKVVLRTVPYNRGAMVPISPGVTLIELTTSTNPVVPALVPLATLPTLVPIGNPSRTQTVVLSDMGMGTGAMMGGAMGAFTINGKVFDPLRDDLTMSAGVPEEWIVRNDGMMDHPLHIHGTSFQLKSSNRLDIGSDPRLGAFMDTVNLQPGEEIRIWLRIDTIGRRMFHCHILEHEAQGMMGIVNVQ